MSKLCAGKMRIASSGNRIMTANAITPELMTATRKAAAPTRMPFTYIMALDHLILFRSTAAHRPSCRMRSTFQVRITCGMAWLIHSTFGRLRCAVLDEILGNPAGLINIGIRDEHLHAARNGIRDYSA